MHNIFELTWFTKTENIVSEKIKTMKFLSAWWISDNYDILDSHIKFTKLNRADLHISRRMINTGLFVLNFLYVHPTLALPFHDKREF